MYVKDNKKLFIELKSSTLCQNAQLRNLGETVENLILNTFLAKLFFHPFPVFQNSFTNE